MTIFNKQIGGIDLSANQSKKKKTLRILQNFAFLRNEYLNDI